MCEGMTSTVTPYLGPVSASPTSRGTGVTRVVQGSSTSHREWVVLSVTVIQ